MDGCADIALVLGKRTVESSGVQVEKGGLARGGLGALMWSVLICCYQVSEWNCDWETIS